MLPLVQFAAAFAYSPRGSSAISIKSRRLRDAVKAAHPMILPQLAAIVAQQVQDGELPGVFGPDVTLVPVPGRAPLHSADALWVPERICRVLVNAGLGGEVWPTLRRVIAVPKSAWAAPGERPETELHVRSLEVTDRLPPTGRLLLVDDFVTKGRTLLAAATVVSAALPGTEVQGFALVRTMGLVSDIDRVRDPIVGVIRSIDGDSSRHP